MAADLTPRQHEQQQVKVGWKLGHPWAGTLMVPNLQQACVTYSCLWCPSEKNDSAEP